MVLAAGEGRRLKPLTDHLAKPLIPLLGKTLLRRAVDRVAELGARQVVVNTHYHPQALAQAVHNMAGVRAPLRLSHEDIVLGPLGGIRHALPFFETDWLLVHNADAYLDATPANLRAALQNPPAPVVFWCTAVPAYCPQTLGIDTENRVVSVGGQGPQLAQAVAARGFLGVSLWHLPTLKKALEPLAAQTPLDLAPHVMPELFRQGIEIQTLIHTGYFCDVGTPQRLLAHHRLLLEGKLGEALPFPPRKKGLYIGPFVKAHPSVKFKAPVYVEPHVEIGENAVIGPYVSLSQGAKIGAGATLKDCLVFEAVTVAAGEKFKEAFLTG